MSFEELLVKELIESDDKETLHLEIDLSKEFEITGFGIHLGALDSSHEITHQKIRMIKLLMEKLQTWIQNNEKTEGEEKANGNSPIKA